MAFRQEYALLSGGSVNLNDPYALATSGGVLNVLDASKIAEQAVREKIGPVNPGAEGNLKEIRDSLTTGLLYLTA